MSSVMSLIFLHILVYIIAISLSHQFKQCHYAFFSIYITFTTLWFTRETYIRHCYFIIYTLYHRRENTLINIVIFTPVNTPRRHGSRPGRGTGCYWVSSGRGQALLLNNTVTSMSIIMPFINSTGHQSIINTLLAMSYIGTIRRQPLSCLLHAHQSVLSGSAARKGQCPLRQPTRDCPPTRHMMVLYVAVRMGSAAGIPAAACMLPLNGHQF